MYSACVLVLHVNVHVSGVVVACECVACECVLHMCTVACESVCCMFVFVCCMHRSVCVHMCVSVHLCGGQIWTLGVFFNGSPPYCRETRSVTEQEAHNFS